MRDAIKIILLILIAISVKDFAFGQVTHEETVPYDEPATNATPTVDERPHIHDTESNLIEDFVKNLEDGRLIYNPPENMILNLTESINATIEKGGSSGEPIKIAPYMEVDLNGSAFHIVSTTERRQFIASDRPTTWEWDVTPKKTGSQKIRLAAYVIIKMPDGHEEKRALVKSKTIYININPNEKEETPNYFILKLFNGPWAKPLAGLFAVLAFIITFFKDDILAWVRSRKKQN